MDLASKYEFDTRGQACCVPKTWVYCLEPADPPVTNQLDLADREQDQGLFREVIVLS